MKTQFQHLSSVIGKVSEFLGAVLIYVICKFARVRHNMLKFILFMKRITHFKIPRQ